MKEFANDGVKLKIYKIANRKIKYWKVFSNKTIHHLTLSKRKRKDTWLKVIGGGVQMFPTVPLTKYSDFNIK